MPAATTSSARPRFPPAIALADWLKKSGTPGTIRVYGTPAEEGGSGKVYMVRAGLFNDVDAVMHWHASDVNFAGVDRALANKSAKFRFHGLSAHASGAPEKGRSALDGVEAMDNMANMMREHIPSDARMHYVITSGGSAPNVVPDFAESYYYVRHIDAKVVESIFDRLVKTAEGAALGTGTTHGLRGHRRHAQPAGERGARARDEREAERGRRRDLHARGAGVRREDLRDARCRRP